MTFSYNLPKLLITRIDTLSMKTAENSAARQCDSCESFQVVPKNIQIVTQLHAGIERLRTLDNRLTELSNAQTITNSNLQCLFTNVGRLHRNLRTVLSKKQ